VVDIDAARVAALLHIDKVSEGAGARLEVSLDGGAVDALVGDVAAKVDRPARDASFRATGGGLEVVPSQNGSAIDRDALRSALTGAIFASGDGRSISPNVVVTTPKLTTQAAQQYAGQMTLVSTYTTYFPVNPSRATNIRLGASRFNGLVIAPGASFSFWNEIGDVSLASGFVMSGAIIDGRSDQALGGGLCQVSTTLFNTVARSGYQIDERGPHSYYIERYPIGLDAAVFSPGQDFRWTNDTPYPVMIRSSATATSVTFSLYSIPTGRVTSFSAPSERNLVMPSKSQLADPAYPKGYVVRGRDVWVTRTVTQNGALVRQDTFYSHYSPVWGGSTANLTIR
jgi:vancomycin resistance protein YoaR